MKSKNIFIVLFFIVCALPLRLDAIWVNDNLNAYKVLQKFQYYQLQLKFGMISPYVFGQVLWLGNSYTYVNDVPGTVDDLSIADEVPRHLGYDSHTEGGWTWENHTNSEVSKRLIFCHVIKILILINA